MFFCFIPRSLTLFTGTSFSFYCSHLLYYIPPTLIFCFVFRKNYDRGPPSFLFTSRPAIFVTELALDSHGILEFVFTFLTIAHFYIECRKRQWLSVIGKSLSDIMCHRQHRFEFAFEFAKHRSQNLTSLLSDLSFTLSFAPLECALFLSRLFRCTHIYLDPTSLPTMYWIAP
jgi:hypothetical protein